MLRNLLVVFLVVGFAASASADLVEGIDLGFLSPTADRNHLAVTVTAEAAGVSLDRNGETDVSGNMLLDIDYAFDPDTREVTGINNIAFTGGQCSFDDDIHMNFSKSVIIKVVDIDVDTNDVKCTFDTPGSGPISSFDSGTRKATFATQNHNIILNDGSISIDGWYLNSSLSKVYINETVNLSQQNITATTDGTGYLTTTLQSIVDDVANYKVEMELPVNFSELAYDSGGTQAWVAGTGTFKTEGYFSFAVPNHAPVAVDDPAPGKAQFYTVDEDNTLNVSAANGVLFNDTDDDNDPLTAHLVAGPSHGVLNTFGSDGRIEYVPDADYHGTDSFTYKAKDTDEYSNVATVELNVASVNDLPEAEDDFYTVDQGDILTKSIAAGVLANDYDADQHDDNPNDETLSAEIVDAPDHNGSLQFSSSGAFKYLAEPGWSGVETFTYKAVDLEGAESLATVTINVRRTEWLPGDANGDGDVNEEDAQILSDNWGHTNVGWEQGDFTDDHKVDAADAAVLAANWDASPGEADAAAVPEPSLAALVLSSLLGLAIARRRG